MYSFGIQRGNFPVEKSSNNLWGDFMLQLGWTVLSACLWESVCSDWLALHLLSGSLWGSNVLSVGCKILPTVSQYMCLLTGMVPRDTSQNSNDLAKCPLPCRPGAPAGSEERPVTEWEQSTRLESVWSLSRHSDKVYFFSTFLSDILSHVSNLFPVELDSR